ncbi:MAG: methionine biosynthesis protein MetW [Alphaproteobacteria bacterium]|jgi:methionine biosynthesis protein MetW
MSKSVELRQDLLTVAGLVREGSTLLDVGCGTGELLKWLVANKQVVGRGMELSQQGVNQCIAKGLAVIQGDADIDLQYYPDKAYDVVVLSQTLQTLRNPKEVVGHLVRIGKCAIVSVPNFGHWKNRLYLAVRGRMPVTKTLSYQWYDTPNIHFCTITDFENLCDELHVEIEKRLYVTHQGAVGAFRNRDVFANLFGEQGVFMLTDKLRN